MDLGIEISKVKREIKEIKQDLKSINNRLGNRTPIIKLIECSHCGYLWHSKATSVKISCPSCGNKTDNVEAVNKKAKKESDSEDEVDGWY